MLATAIGFLGSACGTVGGVGGGGIFVPMLTLIVGFDTKSAAALSKCTFPFPLFQFLIEINGNFDLSYCIEIGFILCFLSLL